MLLLLYHYLSSAILKIIIGKGKVEIELVIVTRYELVFSKARSTFPVMKTALRNALE